MNNPRQGQSHDRKQLIRILFWAFIILIALFLLFFRLNSWPFVWWDEGWTLDAARNWIEHGHMGHYLDGIPIPARSPVRFTVAVPVALSMKLFGVGIWQGRLPGVVLTLLSLALIAYLSAKIYNRKVGIATLLILICLSPVSVNPIFIGRQVLAEMPMMFYLLGGYCLLWLAINRSAVWSVAAALLFGIALNAKLQVPPFWLVSMLLATMVAIKYKRRASILTLVAIIVGSIFFAAIVLGLQNKVMAGAFFDRDLTVILFNSVIFVLTWSARQTAIIAIIASALPQMFGYIWAGWNLIGVVLLDRSNPSKDLLSEIIHKDILKAAIWGLGASWFIWYAALALPWQRYLFPPYFIGCIFFAAYLDVLTTGFKLRLLIRQTGDLLLRRNFSWINVQSLGIIILFGIILGVTGKSTMVALTTSMPNAVLVSNYLRENIPVEARVESFESELYFLAPEIKFHYPPDLVSMQLVRKQILDPGLSIPYDMLGSNPDYLVVGPYSQVWRLYEEVLSQGWFEFQAEIGGYQVFKINSAFKNE